MSPISLFCILCGFSTFHFEQAMLRKIINLYCWICVVVCTIVSVNCVLVKLYIVQFRYSSVIDVFSNILCDVVLVMYQVKYLLHKDINMSILDNIYFVDDSLESINVTVPHIRNLIVASTCVALNIISFITFVSTDLLSTMIKRLFGAESEIRTLYEIDLYCNYIVTILFYSVMSFFLYMQLLYIIYVLWQRMGLVYIALVKLDKLSKREVAWTDNVIVSIMNNQERIAEIHYYYTKIYNSYCCLYEAYQSTREFYTSFICINIYFTIASYSLVVIVCVIFKTDLICSFGLLYGLVKLILPALASSCLGKKIDRITGLFNRLRYRKQLKSLKGDMNKWQSDSVFDCEYFRLDISVLYFVLNFISLFVFAILPDLN